jgi:hypothetical protein
VEPVTPLRHDPMPRHQAGSVGLLMRLACTCDWHGGTVTVGQVRDLLKASARVGRVALTASFISALDLVLGDAGCHIEKTATAAGPKVPA